MSGSSSSRRHMNFWHSLTISALIGRPSRGLFSHSQVGLRYSSSYRDQSIDRKVVFLMSRKRTSIHLLQIRICVACSGRSLADNCKYPSDKGLSHPTLRGTSTLCSCLDQGKKKLNGVAPTVSSVAPSLSSSHGVKSRFSICDLSSCRYPRRMFMCATEKGDSVERDLRLGKMFRTRRYCFHPICARQAIVSKTL